ncbi:hypothetical protein J4734_14270 [Klebsiella pneumoniae]|uniref:Uncharacterized protein n=1 Tax=Klebsiella pneumoniae TaxID=573 RepID=A0A939NN43_KLEPN|nr:hypothetical protein [Klebsiella pneumoniae]
MGDSIWPSKMGVTGLFSQRSVSKRFDADWQNENYLKVIAGVRAIE